MKKIIIAAIAKNLVIGKEGKIPWYNPEEIRHFQKTTIGFPVLMGRKTFESIRYPLKDRINIILTHDKFYNQKYSQILTFDSISNALVYCEKNYEKIFIIGGESIFKQTISIADEMIISKMNLLIDGDTYFPGIELSEWKLNSISEYNDFTVHYYIRK